MQKLNTDIFIKRAKEVHGEAFDYSKSTYRGYQSPIEIICKKHGPFFQKVNDHLSRKKGEGCPRCYNERRGSSSRMSFEEFIERCNKIHNSKYSYEKPSSWRDLKKLKIKIYCPIHGEFYQRVSDHLYLACGCPTCCESKGEKFVTSYLEELGLKFEREKIFEWLKNPKTNKSLPLDFFIEDLNLAIEVDGGQHRYPVSFFGGDNGFQERRNKDLLRENLCRINGISLIRVFYSDFRDIKKTVKDLDLKVKERMM